MFLITLKWGASGILLELEVGHYYCFRDDISGQCPAAPAAVLAQCTATSQRCAGRHRSHLINTGRRERCAGRLIEPMGHSLTVRADSISQNIDSATWVFKTH